MRHVAIKLLTKLKSQDVNVRSRKPAGDRVARQFIGEAQNLRSECRKSAVDRVAVNLWAGH